MTVSAVPSAQPAFPCRRNQQVWFKKTGSALTTTLLSLGVLADLWLGTSQRAVHHSDCFVRDSRQSISRSRCWTSCWKRVSEICWSFCCLRNSASSSWDTGHNITYSFIAKCLVSEVNWVKWETVSARCMYAGNPVEVGITMHVSSVSHISEVNMVSASCNSVAHAVVTLFGGSLMSPIKLSE